MLVVGAGSGAAAAADTDPNLLPDAVSSLRGLLPNCHGRHHRATSVTDGAVTDGAARFTSLQP